MVETSSTSRPFDGANPNDIVFGETLGEGKWSKVLSKVDLVCRRLWSRQSGLAQI